MRVGHIHSVLSCELSRFDREGHLTDRAGAEFHRVKLPTDITSEITSYRAFWDFPELCHLENPEKFMKTHGRLFTAFYSVWAAIAKYHRL